MELQETEQFVASVPWRWHWRRDHQYALRYQVDGPTFDAFVALIQSRGYRGRYHHAVYRYLRLGEWIYWSVSGPGEAPALNRCTVEDRQHEPLEEQLPLEENR
jgi:hypothetical protein